MVTIQPLGSPLRRGDYARPKAVCSPSLDQWEVRDRYLRIAFWPGDPADNANPSGLVVVPMGCFVADGQPCSFCSQPQGPHDGLNVGAIAYSAEAMSVVGLWLSQNAAHPLAVHTPPSLRIGDGQNVWQKPF